MPEQMISCPKCGNRFPLSKALTAQIEKNLKSEYDAKYKEHDLETKAAIDKKVELGVGKMRAAVRKEMEQEVRESKTAEVAGLHRQLRRKDQQLKDIERREESLEQRETSLDANIKQEVDKARKRTREEVVRSKDLEHMKKELLHKKIEDDLRKQLRAATEKLEQGSEQRQGEVIELALEELLRRAFPSDKILPVPQGKQGADIIQKVRSPDGNLCGSIVWESKDVKNWNSAWISKLKDDQRSAKAELAVLVTSVFPKELDSHLGLMSGIWVVDRSLATGLCAALRLNLLEVARIKQAVSDRPEKMEIVYQYLMSVQFRQRVEAIVESFVTLNEDLDSEKRTMERQWAKREKQIQQVIANMSGMVGDIHGIEPAFPPIRRLELPTHDTLEKQRTT